MDNCPKCGSDWVGDKIPKDIVEHYAGTHWKREIGIDGGRMGIYDGTVALKCPDCKEVVPRNGSKWAKEMFEAYLQVGKKTDD